MTEIRLNYERYKESLRETASGDGVLSLEAPRTSIKIVIDIYKHLFTI